MYCRNPTGPCSYHKTLVDNIWILFAKKIFIRLRGTSGRILDILQLIHDTTNIINIKNKFLNKTIVQVHFTKISQGTILCQPRDSNPWHSTFSNRIKLCVDETLKLQVVEKFLITKSEKALSGLATFDVVAVIERITFNRAYLKSCHS